VSQQRSEAMRLMRDGLEAHYSESAQAEPHSKIAPARRAAYLARLAGQATLATSAAALPVDRARSLAAS
jgi:RNA polymerase sigma factor for flagellar operon FliA